jgi:hypothetical protein
VREPPPRRHPPALGLLARPWIPLVRVLSVPPPIKRRESRRAARGHAQYGGRGDGIERPTTPVGELRGNVELVLTNDFPPNPRSSNLSGQSTLVFAPAALATSVVPKIGFD